MNRRILMIVCCLAAILMLGIAPMAAMPSYSVGAGTWPAANQGCGASASESSTGAV